LIYDDLWDHFGIDSYQEIPEFSFGDALEFIENWEIVKVIKQ
jgi:hypothetical protein